MKNNQLTETNRVAFVLINAILDFVGIVLGKRLQCKTVPVFLIVFCSFGDIYAQVATSHLSKDFANTEQLKVFVDSLVASEMEKEFLPGAAVSIVVGDDVLMSKAYGYANLEKEELFTTDETIFRIASISKVFTTVALMQLVDQGRVHLHDEVNKYLSDELKIDSPYDDPIRIWHLLSHTSGFDQILSGRDNESRNQVPSLEEFLKGQLIPIRPPGLISTYDTYGITLAGHIIERVSGLSYPEYMRENIFKTLGMVNTHVQTPISKFDRLATGYGYEDEQYIPQEYEWYSTTPASSIDGTMEDMILFMQALLSKDSNILSAETTEQIKEPLHNNYPGLPGFSYGFWEDYKRGVRAIYHGGINKGYSSHMYLLPKYNVGIFVMYNRDPETGPAPRMRDILVDALMERWFEEPEKMLPDTTNPFPIHTEKIAGVYANSLYCHTCYEGEGAGRGIFPVESKGIGKIHMWGADFYAVSDNTFITETGLTKAIFLKDFNGNVRYMGMGNNPSIYEKLGEPLIKSVLNTDVVPDSAAPIIAMTYRGMGETEKAIKAYNKILEIRPDDGVAWYYLGDLYRSAGNKSKAIDALKETIRVDKWKPWAAYAVAELYAEQTMEKETLEWIDRAIEYGMDGEQFIRNGRFDFLKENEEFKSMIES